MLAVRLRGAQTRGQMRVTVLRALVQRSKAGDLLLQRSLELGHRLLLDLLHAKLTPRACVYLEVPSL